MQRKQDSIQKQKQTNSLRDYFVVITYLLRTAILTDF